MANERLEPGRSVTTAEVQADRICAMTRFDNSVLPWFFTGLPATIKRAIGETPDAR